MPELPQSSSAATLDEQAVLDSPQNHLFDFDMPRDAAQGNSTYGFVGPYQAVATVTGRVRNAPAPTNGSRPSHLTIDLNGNSVAGDDMPLPSSADWTWFQSTIVGETERVSGDSPGLWQLNVTLDAGEVVIESSSLMVTSSI